MKSLQHRALASLQKHVDPSSNVRAPMALSVGIVGLPGAGKTTLFNALTGAGAGADYGKEHVGMALGRGRAAGPGGRGDRVPPKVTPAAIRVVDVPGTGAGSCSATCVRRTRSSPSSTASPRTPTPTSDLETLRLELQVADRDHVERRLERVAQAGEVGRCGEARRGRPARGAARARRRRRVPRRRGRPPTRARAAHDQAAARRS